MFSSTTTELSINRDSASANPPSTIVLIELPPNCSATNVASAESGMEKNTATVERMLPRNTRIISDVRSSPSPPSCNSVSIALFTNSDWSKTTEVRSESGVSTSFRAFSRMPSTTAMVLESPPCLRIGRYTERCPLTRTTLYCSVCESTASPMSDTRTGDCPTILSGVRLISAAPPSMLLV